MGQEKKNHKGSVSIINAAGRIRLRFRFQKQRFSLNLFSYSKSNLLAAKKIALAIENDLVQDSFDRTLEKYKPIANKEAERSPVSKTLVTYFEEWVRNYRNMDCDKDVDYNSTRNMMLRWGTFDLSEVVKHFNSETFSASTYNRRLNLLKKFFNWTTKTQITLTNPLEDVLVRKVRKTDKPKRKPFNEEEILSILDAFKQDKFCPASANYKHSHYYPFLYFIFKLGPRNGEAIGLRVKHIQLEKNRISIKETLSRTLKGTNAAARIRKETKNGKERVLPLDEDLKVVLLPLLLDKNPDDLVFTSPTGVAIDDRMFQKRVFSKVLKELNIEPRNLYACRHTFGSRCIHQGLTPVMTAFLMGNNPETALRNYTHQLDLPKSLPSIERKENKNPNS
ncbi:MAG: hypothetical protein JWP69_1575 [Flaviaesturariibacter sp.]|nr:hypothetical protein [Flaviaesturariibacter sp.]